MRTLHTLLAVAGTVAAVALPGSAAALTDPGGPPAGPDAAPAARTALKQDTAFAAPICNPSPGGTTSTTSRPSTAVNA